MYHNYFTCHRVNIFAVILGTEPWHVPRQVHWSYKHYKCRPRWALCWWSAKSDHWCTCKWPTNCCIFCWVNAELCWTGSAASWLLETSLQVCYA